MSGSVTPEFARKLVAVVSRLASNHEGEVLAAAAAANRLLAAHGLQWPDVVLPGLPAPADDAEKGGWRADIEFCLRNAHGVGLTFEEANFLFSLKHYDHEPSRKQLAWLRSIARKVRARRAGAA